MPTSGPPVGNPKWSRERIIYLVVGIVCCAVALVLIVVSL